MGYLCHQSVRGWAMALLAFGGLALYAPESLAACAFQSHGRHCYDLTERCQPGCPDTSCAQRAEGLISPNSLLQFTPDFQGAIGDCSGAGDRQQVFECAWANVVQMHPQLRSDQCVKDRLFDHYHTIALDHGIVEFDEAQLCDWPTTGEVPTGYFAPDAPRELLDDGGVEPPPGEGFNDPPAHHIGAHEGRLIEPLRRAARVADPLSCSLRLSAIAFSRGDDTLGRAYADLSVTGRLAFEQFREARPGEAYCRMLAFRPPAPGCPTAGFSRRRGLVNGCREALDRAYDVANYLRVGQMQPAAVKEQARAALGWIAVSGEDDRPHRPVNVPSSAFPQYDIEVLVDAPRAPQGEPRTIAVPSRFTIAQSNPPPPVALPAPGTWSLAPEPEPTLDPDAEVVLFIHGMGSRAEESEHISRLMFERMGRNRCNLAVIAVDLPTSGYAASLGHEAISDLRAIGWPTLTPLPVPVPIDVLQLVPGLGAIIPPGLGVIPPGTPIPDFHATGATPMLDFIESFIVGFVGTLDDTLPIEHRIIAVMGGSLGGSMSFRLGRRPNTPWLERVIAWSPASSVPSLAGGFDIVKHQGPRATWEAANDRDVSDPDDLSAARLDRRRDHFAATWDEPIFPLLVPAQPETWTSQHYPCRDSAIAAARLDRHETYDADTNLWNSRLAAEQLIYSHQTIDPTTDEPRYAANTKPMLLACGMEDNFNFNQICEATRSIAPNMWGTPGRALFLDETGHSLHDERGEYFAGEVVDFLCPVDAWAPASVPPLRELRGWCTANTHCRSERCDIGRGTMNTRRCIPNDGTGRAGDACNHNNQCRAPLTCTTPAAGQFGTCVADRSVSDGGLCSAPQQCESDRCSANRCRALAGLNEWCGHNADCRSGVCDAGFGTMGTNRCVPAYGTGRVGDWCNHNNQCQRGLRCPSPGPGIFRRCER